MMENKHATNYAFPDIVKEAKAKVAKRPKGSEEIELVKLSKERVAIYLQVPNVVVDAPTTAGGKERKQDVYNFTLFEEVIESEDVIKTLLKRERLLLIVLFSLQKEGKRTTLYIEPTKVLCNAIGVKDVNALIETFLSVGRRPLRLTRRSALGTSPDTIQLINARPIYDSKEFDELKANGTLKTAKTAFAQYHPNLKCKYITVEFPEETLEHMKSKYWGLLVGSEMFNIIKRSSDLQWKLIVYLGKGQYPNGFSLDKFLEYANYDRKKKGIAAAEKQCLETMIKVIECGAFTNIEYNAQKRLFYNIKKATGKHQEDRIFLPEKCEKIER